MKTHVYNSSALHRPATMTFWGIEIHPEKPYYYSDEDGMTKLHLSQATLGLDCKGKQRTVVKCKVGENPEVPLCSLVPGVSESCALDLLFDQGVTFTVSGATSVHLTGYYMPIEEPYSSEEEGFEFSEEEEAGEDVSDLEGHTSSVEFEEVQSKHEAKDAAIAQLKQGVFAITNGERNGKKRKKGDTTVKPVKGEVTAMDEDSSEDEDGFALVGKKGAEEQAPVKKQAVAGAVGVATPSAATPSADTPASEGEKKRNKKNKHQTQTPETKVNGEAEVSSKTETPSAAKEAAKESTSKRGASPVKKFPNGLEVETLAIGKPDGCPPFRALCCDTVGFLKVVEVASDKSVPQVVARWGPQPTLCTAFGEDGIALARKNGKVEVLNPSSGVRLAEIGVPTSTATDGINGKSREDASDAVCGLHLFKKTSTWGTAVLTCTEQGVAAIQRIHCRDEDEDMGVSTGGDEDMGVSTSSPADAIVWRVSDSGCILCLRVDCSERYALFGGKGVDVSLWDLEKRTRVWSAKNPRRDNLGLIAPAYVTALAFLSDKDHSKFVVGTGHHQIRLYDTTRSQRRPVMMFDYGESPIKSIAPDGDGYTVYVGTGSGDLGCFDMRIGQKVGGFKGKIAGSVRSVVRHPTLPLIASCGLDRYLRIHHSKTRQLLAMLFLKQQLVSVVFDTSALFVLPASESADEEPAVKTSVIIPPKASGGDYIK